MTEAIYLEVSEKTEAAKKAGRRFSVSGMLKFLGGSRSGYHAVSYTHLTLPTTPYV